jgi:hypothetical protein
VIDKYPQKVLEELIPEEFDKVLKKAKEKDELIVRNQEYDDTQLQRIASKMSSV